MFVTVGSTRFDELIERILLDESIEQIIELGFTKLILQVGCSSYSETRLEQVRQDCLNKFEIELYDYKTSISDDIEKADVIVGHAGAGTCLETLRSGKRLLIVVNETLMNNHQLELAEQLSQDNYVVQTTVDKFNENLTLICNSETKLNKFPPRDAKKFEQIFDEALKKVTSRL